LVNAKKQKKVKAVNVQQNQWLQDCDTALFTSDRNLWEGDIDSGEEYDPSCERVWDGVEAKLWHCARCAPNFA